MKILITGSNGLLGQKLVHKLRNNPDVDLIATSRGANRLQSREAYRYRSLDISNGEEVKSVISELLPDVIINTAAMTNVDACEENKNECDALNIRAVQHLLAACERHQIHFIHLSTDFIFNGKEGPYREDAVPDPLSYYGQSKLTAEKLVTESKTPWAILRTILVYGVAEEMSRSNIVLWAKGALEGGKEIKVVDDQFRSPTLAEDLADACILAAQKKAEGTYHISGPDQMSIIELVRRVARFWKLNEDLISPVSSDTLNQKAKRPPITGFILEKARRELGYKPHTFEKGLEMVDGQLGSKFV